MKVISVVLKELKDGVTVIEKMTVDMDSRDLYFFHNFNGALQQYMQAMEAANQKQEEPKEAK